MKLISKEMVLNGLIDWQFTTDDDKEYATIEQMIKSIEETSTVEAIPIEWIDQYMNKFQLHGVTGDEYWIFHSMLCAWEWEEENEQVCSNN